MPPSRFSAFPPSGDPTKERTLLLSAILADVINLGLTKMAESSPGTTYSKLSWLQAWHIRDKTYSSALAEWVITQLANPEEHYTDTAGFTDHVFALMHLLGFRFALRISDLKDTQLYVPGVRG